MLIGLGLGVFNGIIYIIIVNFEDYLKFKEYPALKEWYNIKIKQYEKNNA
jgi:hypothetical protein